jgi:hypothetical protein
MAPSVGRSEAPLFFSPKKPVELCSTGQMRTSAPTGLVVVNL